MAAENHKTLLNMTSIWQQLRLWLCTTAENHKTSQTPDVDRSKKIQIDFMAPFATNVIIDPARLAVDGPSKIQKSFAEELQNEIPIFPFRDQLEKKWKDTYEASYQPNETQNSQTSHGPATRTLYTASHHPNETLNPIVFLEVTLEDTALEELEKKFPDFSRFFKPSDTWTEKYSIEIKKVKVSIYHYGFGNITISTVLSSPDPYIINSNNGSIFEDYELLLSNYKKLFDFIGNYKKYIKHPDSREQSDSKNPKFKQHPVVSQFKPVIEKLREKLHKIITSAESKENLSQFIKKYYSPPRNDPAEYIEHRLLEYDDFFWVHRIYYLPLPAEATEEQKSWYEKVVKKAFCKMTIGTAVESLTYEQCNIAHITPGSSFAMVKNLHPIGEESNGLSSIDDDPVTSSFREVIQTTGIFFATTIELTNSLDLITDAYEATDKDNNPNTNVTDSDITDSIQRISHIRSLINQHERSLPPMPLKFLDAVKKEWNFREQWDYIDWKFEALRDLHDRKSLQRLNIATLSFSIIATIGILFSLLNLARGWPEIPAPSISLVVSLVSIFLAPTAVYLVATLLNKRKPHFLKNMGSSITNLSYKHIFLLSLMVFGIVVIIFLLSVLGFSFVT